MELNAVLEDSQNYPDTMSIDIGGQKVTLGDLRATPQFKGFTKYSQERSREKQELEGRLSQAQQERDRAAQELANAMATSRQAPNLNSNDPLAAFRADATFAPLIAVLDKAVEKADALEKKAGLYEQNIWMNAHVNAIKDIQGNDSEFKDPAKVNELISYAKNNGISNLSLAHRELTRDRDIKKALEEGEKKGIEAGKKKAISEMTMVPSGARRLVSPTPDAPKTFDEAEDAALADPEVLQIFSGSG